MKKKKSICKEVVYTIEGTGVPIKIDGEKVIDLFEEKISNLMATEKKYKNTFRKTKMNRKERNDYIKFIQAKLSIRTDIIRAKVAEKIFDSQNYHDSFIVKVIKQEINKEIGEDKEDGMAEIIVNSLIYHLDTVLAR